MVPIPTKIAFMEGYNERSPLISFLSQVDIFNQHLSMF